MNKLGGVLISSDWAEATAAKAARRMDLANMTDEDERRIRSSERVKKSEAKRS